jgi:NADH-quinone oxidoreductase subunit M
VLAGALICAVLPRTAYAAIRWTATVASAIALILVVGVFLSYNPAGLTFQHVERLRWLPEFGINYFIGADGLSVPMLALTAIVLFSGVLLSWSVEERVKEYFVLLLLLGAGLFGTCMALDLLLMYISISVAVIALFLLVSAWSSTAREEHATQSTIYLLSGLLAILVGILALYFAGGRTFNLIELAQNNDWGVIFQTTVFVPLFLGFAVLAGLFPFHSWVPSALGAAPTAVAMLLVSALLGLGVYGCLRVVLWLLPAGALVWSPILMALALLTLLYGAVLAFMQRDLKGVFSYAAISRSGLVLLGLSILNTNGLDGAALLIFAQGLTLALFFAVAGRMIIARTHTGQLAELGEIGRIIPFSAAVAIIGTFSLVGIPGFTTFLGTSNIMQGAWARYPVVAVIAGIAILITIAYMLRVMRLAFFGAATNRPVAQLGRLSWQEYVVGSLLVALIIGVFPVVLHPLSLSGVGPVLQRLTDAQALVQAVGNPFFGR